MTKREQTQMDYDDMIHKHDIEFEKYIKNRRKNNIICNVILTTLSFMFLCICFYLIKISFLFIFPFFYFFIFFNIFLFNLLSHISR